MEQKKNEKSYEFLKETIKEKPIDKKKIMKHILRILASGDFLDWQHRQFYYWQPRKLEKT